jgi:hypothetical protein
LQGGLPAFVVIYLRPVWQFCLYRNPKPGRNGDEVRQGSRVIDAAAADAQNLGPLGPELRHRQPVIKTYLDAVTCRIFLSKGVARLPFFE